jgi:hypothetical protein
MPKNIDDMEDIIRILVDMLDNSHKSYEQVKLKLREHHYCITCMQHFKNCSCGEKSSDSDSSQSSSSINSDYTSSSDDTD